MLFSSCGGILYSQFDAKTRNLQSQQVGEEGGCHSTITLYSNHVECIKVLLHHHRNFIFRYNLSSLSNCSKTTISKWVFGKIFSQNQIVPILLYRKPNFLIFVRAHVIMTSQKPNVGHVGTLFGTNV